MLFPAEVQVPIIIIKCLQQSPINVQKGSQCLSCAFMEGFPSNLKHSGCHSVCIYSSLHKNLAQAFTSRLHSKMKSEWLILCSSLLLCLTTLLFCKFIDHFRKWGKRWMIKFYFKRVNIVSENIMKTIVNAW